LIRVYIDAASAIARSGFEALLTADPEIEIVHDASEADVVVVENLRTEVAGALLGDPTHAQVAAAVHVAGAGLLVLPAEYAPAFPHSRAEQMTEALTAREMDVIEMLAEGLSNKMIAHRLSISDHTAKFHVNSILAKLHAGTRTKAVTRAIRLGLIKI
jgi:DNA-binding NarL/FixJ family response regulator